MASWRRAEANRFETMRQLTSALAKVALAPALDSYSIRHRDALALDQSDLLTSLHIFNTVATDTDRGQGGDLYWKYQGAGTLNIYLTNSTRVIKKPP